MTDMNYPNFDGDTYVRRLDRSRLQSQLNSLKLYLSQDGGWHTLEALSGNLGHSIQSISARLRDLRKPKFGGYEIARRRVPGHRGLWEYSLVSKLG